MLGILGSIALLCVLGIGGYMYFNHSKTPQVPKPLTAEQAAALQVNLPQMTTNLQTDGLVQFTLTLQANDMATKSEINAMLPDLEDAINATMLQFTGAELKQVNGFDKLKSSIQSTVNQKLQKGSVTKVYFSQIVVQ